MTTALKTGYTTGACAAAAAKAAVAMLNGSACGDTVTIPMPDGQRATIPISHSIMDGTAATVTVKKYAGDDPDVTDGAMVSATVTWNGGDAIIYAAGEGVGTVSKKGLQVQPGEPAINPGPRKMISAAIREVTDKGVKVTISIAGGTELAERTFNPRLGIIGGLSILGTTGIVRPYSHPAMRESLKCTLDVTVANGLTAPVFAAGNIGAKGARSLYNIPKEAVVEVSNEWGFMLECAARLPIRALLIAGHPGKLAKLPMGHWDTHSSRSPNAAPFVADMAKELFGVAVDSQTVEGVFEQLGNDDKRKLGAELAKAVSRAAHGKSLGFPVAVVLVDMNGLLLGTYGDLAPWIK